MSTFKSDKPIDKPVGQAKAQGSMQGGFRGIVQLRLSGPEKEHLILVIKKMNLVHQQRMDFKDIACVIERSMCILTDNLIIDVLKGKQLDIKGSQVKDILDILEVLDWPLVDDAGGQVNQRMAEGMLGSSLCMLKFKAEVKSAFGIRDWERNENEIIERLRDAHSLLNVQEVQTNMLSGNSVKHRKTLVTAIPKLLDLILKRGKEKLSEEEMEELAIYILTEKYLLLMQMRDGVLDIGKVKKETVKPWVLDEMLLAAYQLNYNHNNT
ncbi:MAG: hypothetical protein KGH61_03625 [Candidatus Micrarchaeota archaeon]|nr:hypothetical protein [Candidatus Micrarchaeota archaeon]MDE1848013.1 hypothetical protein [Candidatus Micrarchaeota archaeon]MDE1864610.1 hypothetical protein [Candidatus Micrarchaeota archaeon]